MEKDTKKKPMLHAVLIDVLHENVKVVDIPDELQEIYRLLECDCVDKATRKIGSKYYDLICDDEGLLKEKPKISAIDTLGNIMLVGNLLIVNFDDCGDWISLSADDVDEICRHIAKLPTRDYPDGYSMLTCDY